MTVAFHTLGCKVNQYDTQAIRELMVQAGYTPVSFQEDADIYVINTCTVTGTGDRKSLQLARRIRREHPDARLILCGCLAQKQGEKLLAETGADLILGTQYRGQIVQLLEQVRPGRPPICAVSPLLPGMPFESLNSFCRALGSLPKGLSPVSSGASVRQRYRAGPDAPQL